MYKVNCLILNKLLSFLYLSFFIWSNVFAYDPIGFHDETTCTIVRGWACDQDNFSLQTQIHFYADGPYGVGRFVGATVADVKREASVGSACGGNIKHGFSWSVPNELKDGITHPIYAYALNTAGTGGNVLLGSTGKALLCPGSESNIYILPYVTSNIGQYVRAVYDGLPIPKPASLSYDVTQIVFWRWLSGGLQQNTNYLNAYTGFTPPAPKRYYQYSPIDIQYATGIQWYGNTVGMLNVPQTSPPRGEILPITVQHVFNPSIDIRPWPNRQYELSYKFNLQVPLSVAPNTINYSNYAQAYLSVMDVTTNKWFWIGVTAFDNRGSFINDLYSESDPQTAPNIYNPIVSSSFFPSTSYTHIGKNSSYTASAPWSGMRPFQFRVTYGELQQAILDIRSTFSTHGNISIYPEHYKITGIYFLSEVFNKAGYPLAGALGLSVSDIIVSMVRNTAGS